MLAPVDWEQGTGGYLRVTWEADENPDSFFVAIYNHSDPNDPPFASDYVPGTGRSIDLFVGPEAYAFTVVAYAFASPGNLSAESNNLVLA